jgi:hypothetical protein
MSLAKQHKFIPETQAKSSKQAEQSISSRGSGKGSWLFHLKEQYEW